MGEEQAVHPLAIVSKLGAPSWDPGTQFLYLSLLSEQGEEGVGSLVQWSVACKVKVWEAAAFKDLKLKVEPSGTLPGLVHLQPLHEAVSTLLTGHHP